MVRCFVPLFRGFNLLGLFWYGKVFGLIPSVVLSQFDGPLFYVGIYPDQIALKYHYFYDPLLYATILWKMTYQGYLDMKGFGLIPSVVLS